MQLRSASGAFETTTFVPPTGTITIHGGDGAGSIMIDSVDADFSGTIIIDGTALGSANVDVIVNTLSHDVAFDVTATTITFAGPVDIQGRDMSLAGDVTLADSISAGQVTLRSGTLALGPDDLTADVTLQSGAEMEGSGRITGHLIAEGGALINPSGSVDVGSAVLQFGSTVLVSVNGTTAGSDYGQLRSGGVIALDNATLNVNLGFLPTFNDRFVIFQSAAGGAITGTFDSLSDGDQLTIGSRSFEINYDGGDGNDIAITTLNVAPVAVAGGPYVINEGEALAMDGSGSTDLDSTNAPANNNDIVLYEWDFDYDGDMFNVDFSSTSATHTIPAFTDDFGTRTIALRVTDAQGAKSIATTNLAVLNVAPTVEISGHDSVNEGSTYTLNLSATDPGDDTIESWFMDWGDGSDPDGDLIVGETILGNPSSTTHVYADGTRSYTILATGTDDDGGSSSVSFDLTVANVAPTLDPPALSATSIEEDGSVTLTGTFTDPGLLDTFTVEIDWNAGGNLGGTGQGVSTLTQADLTDLGDGQWSFSRTHQYSDDDPTATASDVYTISVTASDGVDPGTASASIAVSNVTPEAGLISAPVEPQAVNTSIAVSAPFTDVGSLDTHTAEWDWGDGTTSAGIVEGSGGSGTADGSHIYTAAGVYTVRLTITDDDTGESETLHEYVVVYDPSAGFVTGGGWIDSPTGAYTADPGLAGKATFGFVSKYKKGQSIPDGQTQFQFKAGDLNLHSTSYEWLVVAGANAKFKGEGTINGQGNYGFMLTATDGQASGGGGVDTFRIKIWDIDLSDAVVYDNKIGASDDGYDGTALGGGSVVIHENNGKQLTAVEGATAVAGMSLTQAMLDEAVTASFAQWAAAGVSARQLDALAGVDFELAALPGSMIGLASSSTNKVWLDVDGAGIGWSLDGGPNGYDLLSAVSHEIGHKLGFDHDVLGAALAPGAQYLVDDLLHLGQVAEKSARLKALKPILLSGIDAVFERLAQSRYRRPSTEIKSDFRQLPR
jgi:hypothetical protein